MTVSCCLTVLSLLGLQPMPPWAELYLFADVFCARGSTGSVITVVAPSAFLLRRTKPTGRHRAGALQGFLASHLDLDRVKAPRPFASGLPTAQSHAPSPPSRLLPGAGGSRRLGKRAREISPPRGYPARRRAGQREKLGRQRGSESAPCRNGSGREGPVALRSEGRGRRGRKGH